MKIAYWLSDKNVFLDFENKANKKQVLEFLVAEKEEKISEISFKLERTQKNLTILNFHLANLEQILFNGKIVGDHKGLGFKGEYSNLKTSFVKFDLVSVTPTGLSITTRENLPAILS